MRLSVKYGPLYIRELEGYQRKENRLFSRRWLKIACALLILLFSVGGGLYFYYEASRITPGESKAILTLEDGSAKQLKNQGKNIGFI